MDTGKKIIESPEGKENYSENRWVELADKYPK
jgi:hypothetical protein